MTDQAKTQIDERKSAMRILSLTSADVLEQKYDSFDQKPDWTFARKPETGLVMTRGRIGGGGSPFNLGELTVTRAAVTLESGETGHAYCHGRNQRKAAIAAFFDAAFQSATLKSRVEAEVLAPCAKDLEASDIKAKQEAAATKVDFFTMTRGDD